MYYFGSSSASFRSTPLWPLRDRLLSTSSFTLSRRLIVKPLCASVVYGDPSLDIIKGTEEAKRHLQVVLDAVRGSLSPMPLMLGTEVVATGSGEFLGMDVGWQLRWQADGAFREELRGKDMTILCGASGPDFHQAWELDDAGCPRHLQLDDREVRTDSHGNSRSFSLKISSQIMPCRGKV
jgi:hypothetical protein